MNTTHEGGYKVVGRWLESGWKVVGKWLEGTLTTKNHVKTNTVLNDAVTLNQSTHLLLIHTCWKVSMPLPLPPHRVFGHVATTLHVEAS